MWPGFNTDRNFLTDTLRHYYPTMTVHGTLYEQAATAQAAATAATATVTPHLVIVGPYSEAWKSIPASIPKVYLTGENWHIQDDPSIALYLSPSRQEDDRHFRLPTWMSFIDWFSPATTLPPPSTDNPNRLPLGLATHPHPIPFHERPDFCAFVVSNPIHTLRNEAFQKLNEYKRVNSGGALFNNIGGPLSLLYPGGGAGDCSKHEFFTRHRFTLSFENSQSAGYITEKVLHAKMAGCVPLYWGDPDTDSDFAPNAIVNLSHLKDPAPLVDIVKRLEANPAICQTIASTPLLNEEKTKQALERLQRMCECLLRVASVSAPLPATITPNPDANPTPAALKGIHRIQVINLDRRRDRWENLLAAEPELASATRLPAVDGKTLTLTPALYQLFRHNQFEWKKGVVGCALSHMMAWSTAEKENAPYTLILEDDVRFQAGWRTIWNEAADHIPKDADLLYLGGVLPPNRPALPHALGPVNAHWSRILPNTFFHPTPAPIFHFCAYSYVLTASGAKKMMTYLRESDLKFYTGADHMIASPLANMNPYVLTPQVAHCFQDDDPAYQNSQFNQLQRVDTFDSDLWNNTERFYPDRELPSLFPASSASSTSASPPASEPASSPSIAPLTASSASLQVYYMATEDPTPPVLYEHAWLEDLFGQPLTLLPLTSTDTDLPPNAWYLVQRPHSVKWNKWFHQLQRKNIPFKILHLSDEFGTDIIGCYDLPNCKAIVRIDSKTSSVQICEEWETRNQQGDVATHKLLAHTSYEERTRRSTYQQEGEDCREPPKI